VSKRFLVGVRSWFQKEIRRKLMGLVGSGNAYNPFKRMICSFLRHSGGRIGLVLFVFYVVVTLCAHQIAPYDPCSQDPNLRLQPPSRTHLMGGDQLGRDVFTRVLYGGRISLRVGIEAVALGAVIGVVLGLPAGALGGWVDTLIMRAIDVLLAFPGILLALMVIAVLGVGIDNVVIAIGVSLVPPFARLTRASALSVREELYVEAARSVGASETRIMLRHILPNLLGPVVVFGTLQLGTSILTAAGLSFLGLGAQPPTPEWGLMCSQGRNFLGIAWWISTFPGLALTLVCISLNLIGDAFRDALDPKTRSLLGH